MFMCDRPFNPALLELFKAQFQEIFFSIREVEAERIVRQHTRSRTVQTMLRSFGHDGRRFADGITLALGLGTNIGELDDNERMAIGRWLAQNLASRLYVYQTLIGDEEITSSFYREEKSRKRDSVELADLIRREVAILLLRSAVEESEFSVLAESLDLATVKKPLIQFAKDAARSRTPYPSGELREMEQSMRSVIELSWNGFDGVVIPAKLDPDENRTTVSRISAGLGFIMSELLTNVFRHQFSQMSDLNEKLPLALSFSFRHDGQAGYELEVRSKPAFKPSVKLSKSNPTGLASLVFIANALQVKIADEELQIGGRSGGRYPYPYYDDETGEQVSLITGISADALL
jgi:hypothetical protein